MVEFWITVTLCFFYFSFSFHFFLSNYSIHHRHFTNRWVYPHLMMQKLSPRLLICFLKFFSVYLLFSVYFTLRSLFSFSSSFSSIMRGEIHLIHYHPSTKKRVSHRPKMSLKINHYDLFIFYALIFCPFVFYASFKTFICAFYVSISIFYAFYVSFYVMKRLNLNRWIIFVFLLSFWAFQYQNLLIY